VWDKAEAALAAASEAAGIETSLNRGEGAFLRAQASNSCCATQSGAIGNAAPYRWTSKHAVRLGATYVGDDGQKHTPVMLHRACSARWSGLSVILLEHHAENCDLACTSSGRGHGN